MENEKSDFVAFQGLNPKPPPAPNWACLLKHSADFGEWQSSDTPEKLKKKHKHRRKRYEYEYE